MCGHGGNANGQAIRRGFGNRVRANVAAATGLVVSPSWQCPMPATARSTYAHYHVVGQAGAKPKLYNPRHPERTLLCQTMAEHFETWFEMGSAGQSDGRGDHHTPKPYVRQAFRKYLECGIFAHGFARAWCDDSGHNYFVTCSCKGRGVSPSCNTRRMVETAAHLCDHVFPACRCASGCTSSRSGCATTCSVTGQY